MFHPTFDNSNKIAAQKKDTREGILPPISQMMIKLPSSAINRRRINHLIDVVYSRYTNQHTALVTALQKGNDLLVARDENVVVSLAS